MLSIDDHTQRHARCIATYMSSNHRQKEKKEIARNILAYLADHPDAHDTLDGIAQWWLLERKIKCQTALVKGAIDELVQEKLILEYKIKDARTHYLVNKNKYEQIRTLLNKATASKR